MDDICIYTETAEEHLDVLKEVFRRLRKAKLKVNINKCHWMNQRIKLLGHFIENGKIEMDNVKEFVKALFERGRSSTARVNCNEILSTIRTD